MSDNRPIGIFDSGLGGLTVVRELQRLMPTESLIYLGDTARVPYGTRSDEAIRLFAEQDTRFFIRHDIKMLIVACNTVSSVALDHVRSFMKEIPVIGVVHPGSKAAVLRTAERKIGVIGTHATIRTNAYAETIGKIDASIKVYGKACPLFVPLVEEGMAGHEIARSTAQHYLYELVDIGIDCLILGCTHYPLLLETIMGTVGTSIELIDSAMWAAKEAQDILQALGQTASMNQSEKNPEVKFFVTDITPSFSRVAGRFLGKEVPNIQRVNIEDPGENDCSA